MDEHSEIRKYLEPFVGEVMPGDDEIERMIREEAARLMDLHPERLANVEDLNAIVNTRVSLAVERRLRETYPHLFGGAS